MRPQPGLTLMLLFPRSPGRVMYVAGHRCLRGIGGVLVPGTPVLMNNPICRFLTVLCHRFPTLIMVESPSHYGAPDVPVDVPALFDTVACMSQVSAFSSVLLSPNRVREDCTPMTADVFPIYQVSPDTTGYQPATSPITPPIPKPPGATGSFDSLIGLYLLDQETDFSCLLAPLLAFPDDLLLIPVPDSRSTSLCISHHGGRLPQSSLFRGNSREKDLLMCTARCLTQGVIR